MKFSLKIISLLFVAEAAMLNVFVEDSFAARGRRVRGAAVTVPTSATTEVENPFTIIEETAPASDDSLSKLAEKLEATTEDLNEETTVDADSGIIVKSGSVVGGDDVPVAVGDIKQLPEYKELKKVLQDFCSAGDMAPLYFACFNKYKLESAFLEGVEELEIGEEFDIIAMQEEFNKMIKKKKIELCADGDGKWVAGKETCKYMVTYKRKGQSVDKWFNVGKRFECGHDTFGLGIMREEVDDSAKKMAMIMGSVQTGLSAINMVSNSAVSFGGKKKDDGKLTRKEKRELRKNGGNIEEAQKNKQIKIKADKDAAEALRKKQIDELKKEKAQELARSYGSDRSSVRAEYDNKIKAASASTTTSSGGNEFDLDLDSFEGVAEGVGGMMEANIMHKEEQRNADEIYGVCDFGNNTIQEGNTVRIDWIF